MVGGGEDEVLDGDDFEEVFIVAHQLLEGGVAGSRADVLGRRGFGAGEDVEKDEGFWMEKIDGFSRVSEDRCRASAAANAKSSCHERERCHERDIHWNASGVWSPWGLLIIHPSHLAPQILSIRDSLTLTQSDEIYL